MKKIFYSIIVAGLALVSAACQKLDEQIITPGASNDLTVTASIVNFDGTKVSYAFTDPENSKSGIKPSWVENDEIFGFDDKGGTFSFSVEDIDDNGKATFSTTGYSPAEGVTKLYAVYYPGKSVSDLDDNALAVNLSSQSGTLNGDAPAIMCATGTIKDNIVNFAFTNQTAVVGIYKMQVYKNGAALATSPITGVSLGNVLAQGTIKLEGGEFKLYPGEIHGTISAENLNLTTDGEGCVEVSSPSYTYFAVIPEENASITVNASDEMTSYKTNASITGKINAGSYYYLGKKIYGGVVATVGGNSYATVSEAFAAATDGQTIQLQNDCDFDSQITLADKSGEITLDLNGCTLKNGPTLNNKQSRFYLNNEDVTLIIQDLAGNGKITSDKVDQDIIRIIKGNLKVVSGTIEAPSGGTAGGNAAIWVEPATSGATTDASVTIQGTANIQGPASFEEGVTGKRAYALYVDNPGADVSVSGGEFSAQSNNLRIMDAKSVNITGGTFTCSTAGEYTLRFAGYYTCTIGNEASVSSKNAATVYVNTDENATESVTLNVTGGKYKNINPESTAAIISRNRTISPINVTGGLFSKEVSANYIPSGYTCTANTDPSTSSEYGYKVEEEGDPVVSLQIGSGASKNYPSLEAAVGIANGADQNCTITLIASEYTLENSAEVSNTNATVTLDLAGNTLKQNGTKRFGVTTGGTLIITDTQGTGTLTQSTSTSANTISIDAGSLVIQGGTITQVSGATVAAVLAGGTANVTVSGGKILATSDNNDAIQFSGTGNLTINGGIVEAVGTSDENNSNAVQFNSTGSLAISGNAIVKNGKRTLYVNNGTISVTGGTISNNAGVAIYTYGTNKCVLTISDGTVTSETTNAIYCTSTSSEPSTVTVSGGKFKRGSTAGVISKAGTCTSTISVTGGLFNVAPNSDFIDGVHAVVDNQDEDTKTEYPKTVVEQEAQVTLQIGTGEPQNYSTVEGAVGKANKEEETCVITLLKDCTVSTSANVKNSDVTIDLAEHTLTYSSNNRIGTEGNGVLKMKNGTLTNSGKTNVVTMTNGGTFEMENVKVVVANGSTYVAVMVNPDEGKTSNFKMKGGSIDAGSASAINVSNAAGTPIVEINGAQISGNHANGAFRIESICEDESAKVEIKGETQITSTSFALNLKGKVPCTISGETQITSTATGTDDAAIAVSDGIVNINGGIITGSGNLGALSLTGGSAVITGGTLLNGATNSVSKVVCTVAGATVDMSGGTIGTLSTSGSGLFRAVRIRKDGIFKLSGTGQILSRRCSFYMLSNGKVEMTGGTINTGASGNNYYAFTIDAAATGSVSIMSGNVKIEGSNSRLFGKLSGETYTHEIPSNVTVTLTGGKYTKQPSTYTGVIPDTHQEISIQESPYSWQIKEK